MRTLASACCLLAFAWSDAAQPPKPPEEARVSLAELQFLIGEWEGALEFVDPAVDRAKRKVAATFVCKKIPEALEYRFTYVDAQGKKVEEDLAKAAPAEGGARVQFGPDLWRVTRKTVDAPAGRVEIAFARDGMENSKPAEFRRTVVSSGQTLVIKTESKPEKSDEWSVRTEYSLKKK